MRMTTRPSWKVALATAVLAASLASGGTYAMANHVFDDSTDNQAFHDEVGRMSLAGCATGFPDGTFRPQDNVNRQQFAAWMVRCGGRVSHAVDFNSANLSGAGTNLVSAVMEPGFVGVGTTGYVSGQANVQVYVPLPTTCPCRVNFSIRETFTNTPVPNTSRSLWLPANATATDVFVNGSVSWLYEVDPGENTKFLVEATLADGGATVAIARSDMTLTYFPFLGVN
jgi:hypothetical protein